jgi:hypothetical protein
MHDSIRNQRATRYLEKCNATYLALASQIRKLSRTKDPERVLRWVQLAAQFGWTMHPGYYADGRIENPALEIGQRLELLLPQMPRGERDMPMERTRTEQQRILHVATTVYETGGHTRLIRNWVENDTVSTHSLVLTQQGDFPLPTWLSEVICAGGGTLTILPERLSVLQRALSLREIGRETSDVVLLHAHPDDVIPVVAFADTRLPPVALMNHADHVFWLGASVADLVIDMRSFGKELTEERRFAKRSMLLPLPLEFKESSLSREEARRQLRLDASNVALLSIGSSYKYKPTGGHNFYETVDLILEQNPTAHFYLVGVSVDQMRHDSGKVPHPRAHFLGPIEDPACYQVAADIYLEGFPYGSLTAMLETVAMGVCPVVMFDPPMPHVDNADSLGGSESVKTNQTQKEYIEYVTTLVNTAAERSRIGTRAKEFIISTHSTKSWNWRLQRIYQFLFSTKHQPAPLPEADFRATASDLGLATFSYSHFGGSSLLLTMANEKFAKLSQADVVGLFWASLKSRDTRISFASLRNWLGLMKTKVFDT